ncbi:acyltransferase family protein [Phycicoccus sonneratiae]|uniref:Acyltransferase n=1 Tax=Phycicoccus sonneratiae TaxID=2807628 RepID=A0ABS2CI02_9MICO|nr:acyltransferase family protein [Phycicoccus sonneraticus]MBM6399492.1 acyltransferase [Phycicoccus sonneraticus]
MSAPGTVAAPRATRSVALDWLRGAAIVLVVLSHMWALWSLESLTGVPPLLHVLQSGNIAVTVFLVVAGFLLVRSLVGSEGTRDDDAGRVGTIAAARPAVAVLTRVVRVAAQTYPLLLVVWFTTLASSPTDLERTQTERSVASVSTFGWNIYLQTQALLARADLGHLWYTAVYVQVAVVLVLVVRGLRHRRLVLAATLAGLLLACTLWRAHVAGVEPLTTALLRTTTRMDGMLWGALAAVLWPWLGPVRRHAGTVVSWSLAAFAVLVLWVGNSASYLGWGGVAANLAVVAVLVAAPGLPLEGRLARVLSWRPAVLLGRWSLAIYVWHYPIFFAVGARLPGWPPPAKAALALVVLAVAVVVTLRWVERPVEAFLERRLRARPADREEQAALPRADEAALSPAGAAAAAGPADPAPSRP